eukprot:684717-Lingulodinium_polyedra.AAC.1
MGLGSMRANGGSHAVRASVAVMIMHARACAAEGLLGSCQNSGHPIYVPDLLYIGHVWSMALVLV